MAEIESGKNEIISKNFAHFRDFDSAIREFESLYPMLVVTAKSRNQQNGILVYDGKRGADKQFENRVRYFKNSFQFLISYDLRSVSEERFYDEAWFFIPKKAAMPKGKLLSV
jgi:hypothetical protein